MEMPAGAPIKVILSKGTFLDTGRGGCEMYTVVINVETASLWPVARGQAATVPVNVEEGFCCVALVSNGGRKRSPMVMGFIDLQHQVESYSFFNFYKNVSQKIKKIF